MTPCWNNSTSKRFHLPGRSKIASCVVATHPNGGGGEKSSPTPVHAQRPFGGEVNKLGEKIVVGRNVWNILFFRESSSPAHDWSVTFGCNVWRIRIDLFFLSSKLNLPIFYMGLIEIEKEKKYNSGRFFFGGVVDC